MKIVNYILEAMGVDTKKYLCFVPGDEDFCLMSSRHDEAYMFRNEKEAEEAAQESEFWTKLKFKITPVEVYQ